MRALSASALLAALIAATAVAAEGDVHFDIVRFQVEGNSLLPEAQLQNAVAPFIGRKRVYGDIQQALEALEIAYRKAGYGTVQVHVPEQELTSGIVRLQVSEAVIGKVVVTGNTRFSDANVRAALPALREGKAPNMRKLSENVQLANENPAKQVEVTLGVSQEEGKVDAKVAVVEENPQRLFVTLDNTGLASTGKSRVGIAYQNANLFDRDHTVTLAYTTSADAPQGVKVDIYSIGYRLPVYDWGDSFDFIYGNSNINTPSTALAPGGGGTGTGLAINGKGTVLGLHWNHYFARRGEYSAKLITGFDYKYINARCMTNGVLTPIDPPNGGGAGCTPYTTRPLSVTYAGQRQRLGEALDYSVGIAHNFPLGSQYDYTTLSGASGTDHYSMVAGGRPVPDSFNVLKAGGSYARLLPQGWQARVALNAQYSSSALPQSEQLGLAGSQAVRGFNERAVAADKGWFANLELYSPELAGHVGTPGSLRALAFYDFGNGFSYSAALSEKVNIASVGAGLRYGLRKDVALRADLAQVVDAGPAGTEGRGDWRGHLNLTLGF